MHDTTAIAAPQEQRIVNYSRIPNYAELHSRYPTTDYLRRRARRHIPYFAFEYSDGGSGKDDAGIRRNWAALDAVELVPRYGVMPALPPCDVKLFGRRYSAPIGVSPMGGPSIIWPGGDKHLARAAQRAGVPYMLSTAGGATIEEIAAIAPGCVLVPALSPGQQRSRHWSRSGAPRRGRRLPNLGADARRAGPHDASAGSGDGHRRRVQS